MSLHKEYVCKTYSESIYCWKNINVISSPKGEITIPTELCEKYGFNDWGLMSVIDMGDGSILLKPHKSELEEIVNRAQKILEEDGVTLDDLLKTLDEERPFIPAFLSQSS